MDLTGVDGIVLFGYFALSVAIGLWFGRGERTTDDFFLGGRRQHWLLAGMSIVATEVSALTVIGVPADAFRGDWTYLQMYAGSFVGRIVIVFLLLPAFYGGAVTTVYEYLGQRFGPATRKTASLLFLTSRVIGSGVRLLAASLAVAVVFDWPLTWVIVGTAALAIGYTTFGGIKAILWTDAMQAVIFVVGPIAVLIFLLRTIPGTWAEMLDVAREAEKLRVFNWDIHPNSDKAFWVLTIHAVLMNMAAFGTDQDLTQRMLTCRDLRGGQKSLLFNACAGFPIVCLFLLVGTMVWVYYQSTGAAMIPGDVLEHKDRIFPHFIATALPGEYGLRGLLVAAIFAASMSSLSSALGALSSTVVTDWYRPVRSGASESHYLVVARMATLAAGAVLVIVALAFAGSDELLWDTFRWVSLVFGGLLGIFLLGVTTRTRGRDGVNVLAMLGPVAVLVLLKGIQDTTESVYIAWPWWIALGTGLTYVIALMGRSRIARQVGRAQSVRD